MEERNKIVNPGYRRLVTWQKGMNLVESVYQATRDWPREEQHGLTSQPARTTCWIDTPMTELLSPLSP